MVPRVHYVCYSSAQDNVKRAQKSQKNQYDRSVREHQVKLGDRVFVYMPSAKKRKAHKLMRPTDLTE